MRLIVVFEVRTLKLLELTTDSGQVFYLEIIKILMEHIHRNRSKLNYLSETIKKSISKKIILDTLNFDLLKY